MPPGRYPKGVCCWCGGKIHYPDGHKRAGQINLQRGWHPGCLGWYKLAAWQGSAADAVWHRAGGACQLCGAACRRRDTVGWRGQHHQNGGQPRTEWIRWDRQDETSAFWGKPGAPGAVQFSRVEAIERPSWQADHIVPLWSLPAPLAIEQRGCFFGLANLWLLCHRCHKAKTSREDTARASRRRVNL